MLLRDPTYDWLCVFGRLEEMEIETVRWRDRAADIFEPSFEKPMPKELPHDVAPDSEPKEPKV